MARGINKVILIGNLASEPDFKVLPTSNSSTATVSIATNESYRDANNQLVERAEFHRLVFWGRLAEIARDYAHKGTLVYVEGRLRNRSWDDKTTGQKRYMTEVQVDNMQLLSSKPNNGQAAPAYNSNFGDTSNYSNQPMGGFQSQPAQNYAPQNYQNAPAFQNYNNYSQNQNFQGNNPQNFNNFQQNQNAQQVNNPQNYGQIPTNPPASTLGMNNSAFNAQVKSAPAPQKRMQFQPLGGEIPQQNQSRPLEEPKSAMPDPATFKPAAPSLNNSMENLQEIAKSGNSEPQAPASAFSSGMADDVPF